MKILVAEDDVAIARALREGLEAAGYCITTVRDGNHVVPTLKASSYDLVLLDVMLPGLDGVEVCREVRSQRISVPVLMLTARGTLRDRVSGLDAGADDYLTKPFEFPELLARVRALLRRHHVVKAAELHVADLYIHTSQRIVRRGDREIFLTPREFTLLEALAQNAGAILSKDTIAERVWMDEYTSPNTVEVHVKNLRRKLEAHGEPKLIQTIHGMGYTIRTP